MENAKQKLEEMKSLVEGLNETRKKLLKEIQSQARPLVEGLAKNLFETCPEIKQVHWTQYTPYFNDGEACTFSVNDICFVLQTKYTDPDLDEDENWDENWSVYDSSILYTEEDLEYYKKRLVEAEKYEADPQAWRDEYRSNYIRDYGREPCDLQHAKPYPDVTRAKLQIRNIENFLELMPAERAKIVRETFDEFLKYVSMIDDDIMLELFDDHSIVVITRNGISVDEYDHD